MSRLQGNWTRGKVTLRFDHPDFTRTVYGRPSDEALPVVNWSCPEISKLPSFADAKRISVDIETRDPHLKTHGPGVRRDKRENYVVGVGIAIEDGPDFYIPLRHEAGGNADIGAAMNYLRDQFHDFHGTITGANLSYDLDWLWEDDVHMPIVDSFDDVQVADPLIYELHDSYSLNSLCKRYELPGKDETVLNHAAAAYKVDPKLGLWRMHAKFVADYCRTDARRPLQILRRQEKRIVEEDVSQIWKLERQVTPILVKMRRRGVRIDVNKLDEIEARCVVIERECMDRVHHLTGVRINPSDVWKANVLAQALTRAGYTVPRTAATRKDSVDKDFLKSCGDVGKTILRSREWNKLRTTFVKQVREQLIHHGGGEYRVHCTFNQLKATDDDGVGRGVRYGRLSSSDFNVQQQPVRHKEFGDLWRSIFVADLDARWGCSDWSQQEPRIGVHYAEGLNLDGAREFADEYRKNPGLDIHQKLADISGMERVIVKNFVNGRLYGMGDLKLCIAIGCPVIKTVIRGEERLIPGPEGRAKIDQFNRFAPWLTGLTRAAAKKAEQIGHVWTILRRKCHFVKGPDGQVLYTHKAFNRIGQGGAADQMKATLVAADREGIPVQMAVHDEFDLSFSDISVPKRLKELQMSTVTFRVPMKVDLEIGPNWGQLEKVTA